jgi:hypothetical protein
MHNLLDVLVALEHVEDNSEVLVAVLQPVQCCPVFEVIIFSIG